MEKRVWSRLIFESSGTDRDIKISPERAPKKEGSLGKAARGLKKVGGQGLTACAGQGEGMRGAPNVEHTVIKREDG